MGEKGFWRLADLAAQLGLPDGLQLTIFFDELEQHVPRLLDQFLYSCKEAIRFRTWRTRRRT